MRRFPTRSPWLSPLACAAVIAGVLLLPLFLAACNSGEQTLTEADPDAAPLFPTYEQVTAIVERNCVPCHAHGKPSGGLGPAGLQEEDDDEEEDCLNADGDGGFDPNFDNCECLRQGFGLLLKVVDEETMPPGAWPRLTEREKRILHNWWNAGGCGPCAEECPQ